MSVYGREIQSVLPAGVVQPGVYTVLSQRGQLIASVILVIVNRHYCDKAVSSTLPSILRVSTTTCTLGQVQSGLKTMLFRLAYGT